MDKIKDEWRYILVVLECAGFALALVFIAGILMLARMILGLIA